MKRLLMICATVLLAVVTASAQRRIPCVIGHDSQTRGTRGVLPAPDHEWNPDRLYRIPVVLITFKDRDFTSSNPVAYYDRMLNETGYNEGAGPGCAADYFREQSGGLFNVHFDIYGPVQADTLVQIGPSLYNDGNWAVHDVMKKLCATSTADFSIYDWNNDQQIDQVVFIAAGYNGAVVDGCIWPNTSNDFFKCPGNLNAKMSSVSCELWDASLGSCGIGTVIHEFCHCLGLPDLYPTRDNVGFSVVDDWDLMDGGNYINWGWCPPNLSAMEKMYLGFGSPVELTEPTSVNGMKPVSEGGTTYLVRNSGIPDEYYLLENRSQTEWDYGVPGNGLLITHVDFDPYAWEGNTVNSNRDHFRYDIFHPDGKSYHDWDPAEKGKDLSRFTMPNRLRSTYLSTTTYPYTDPAQEVIIASLTDDSTPAATLFNANAAMTYFMSKPITNICLESDGTIAFDFMGGTTAINAIEGASEAIPVAWYDLKGRPLPTAPCQRGIYIARYADGNTKKCIR